MTNQETAKNYSKIKRRLSLTSSVIGFLLLIVLIETPFSKNIEEIAHSYTENIYLGFLIFVAILAMLNFVLTFPLSFYSGYTIEHKFELSNQTLSEYFKEFLKAVSVGIILAIPVLLLFYYFLVNFPEVWWFYFGLFVIFFSVVIGRIAPTFIMPLFYKFTELDDVELKNSITAMCEGKGVKVEGVYSFDMSKNTKKANAAFTGLGKSKRIILADTLLKKFSKEEIMVVFAHELGHYKNRHIVKLMTLSVVLTFTGLYIVALLYKFLLPAFGFTSVSELAALPLLAILLSVYSFVTSPLSNLLSRKYEWEADNFALETTANPDAFVSMMEKLTETNLSDKSPNKIYEFLFHSHPATEKRIQNAKEFAHAK